MDALADLVDWFVAPFADYGFMREALLAALITATVCGVVGTWVVLRGMSFLAEALGHGVLPGIAVALLVGFDTSLGALVAALALLGSVQLVRGVTPLPQDSTVGVLYVGFLAFAVVLVSTGSGAVSGDLDRFLFGSILGIDGSTLVAQAVLAELVVTGAMLLHRPLLALTFSPTQAQLWRMRPQLTTAALMALLALAVVVSYRSVGSLLVFAFLVGPAAAASMLVTRVRAMMALAVTLGAVSAVVGLLVSFHYGTAAGATMVLVTLGVFLLSLMASKLRVGLPRLAGAAT